MSKGLVEPPVRPPTPFPARHRDVRTGSGQRLFIVVVAIVGVLLCVDALTHAGHHGSPPRAGGTPAPTATLPSSPAAALLPAPLFRSKCSGLSCALRVPSLARHTTLRWNFGDGHSQQSTAARIVHGYSKPGTYTVTLTALVHGDRTQQAQRVVQISSYSRRVVASSPGAGELTIAIHARQTCRAGSVAVQRRAGSGWAPISTVSLPASGRLTATVTEGGQYRAVASAANAGGGVCPAATSRPVHVAAPGSGGHHKGSGAPAPSTTPAPSPSSQPTPSTPPTTSAPQPTHSPSPKPSKTRGYTPPPPRP